MQEIRALNDKIKSLCIKAELDLTESGFIVNQKNQISLWTGTNNCIRVIKDLICGTANPTRNEVVSIPEIACPKRQCITFSGINPSKFEYEIFLAQFKNCTVTEVPKIQISLSEKLLNWLCLGGENYDIAISMLNKEFLDILFIISEKFKQILNTSLKHDHEFLSVKHYLAEAQADFLELKTSYRLDFFEENTPRFMLVNHIVLDKLPMSVIQYKHF